MARMQRPYELGLQADKAELLSDRSVARSHGLIVHTHGDEVRLELPSRTRADFPPQFRGRIEDRSGKQVLAGVIRESRGEARFTKYNAALVAVGLVIVGIGIGVVIASGWIGLETVAVGLVAMGAGGGLWLKFHRMRAPVFERQAKALETSVRSYLYGRRDD